MRSAQATRLRMAELIKSEDKKHPLSDAKLCDRLNLEGYPISRRTVAKYREAMNIPDYRVRKKV